MDLTRERIRQIENQALKRLDDSTTRGSGAREPMTQRSAARSPERASSRWLEQEVIADARGDDLTTLSVKPADRALARSPRSGERRLEGRARASAASDSILARAAFVSARPARRRGSGRPRCVSASGSASAMPQTKEVHWEKSDPFAASVTIEIAESTRPERSRSVSTSSPPRSAVTVADPQASDRRRDRAASHGGPSVAVVVVNDSARSRPSTPTCTRSSLELDGRRRSTPFVLDSLPGLVPLRPARSTPTASTAASRVDGRSFCGRSMSSSQERLRPTVLGRLDRHAARSAVQRARDRSAAAAATSSSTHLTLGRARVVADAARRARSASDGWTAEMRVEADERSRDRVGDEVDRCRAGLELLASRDDDALTAFELDERSVRPLGRGPVRQMAPVPARLPARRAAVARRSHDRAERRGRRHALVRDRRRQDRDLSRRSSSSPVSSTGMRGKRHGISVWSRFPLRMLSLQQTQRFADALAGAELARRREGIEGDPFALGFLVGQGGTPNKVRDDASDDADATDPDMPREVPGASCAVPSVADPDLEMRFDRRTGSCSTAAPNDDCPWPEEGLPFHVVDEEIYRLLPSVVVGTLDKAASVSMQAAMRGLYAAPFGPLQRPPARLHLRAAQQDAAGCLVPGCTFGARRRCRSRRSSFAPIGAHPGRAPPPPRRPRRDRRSLRDPARPPAAGDRLAGPKNIASSATLAGYEEQVAALYDRDGHRLPAARARRRASRSGRTISRLLARRFVGLAPRGVTLEFANDRLAESLQRAVRRLLDDPAGVCAEIGVDPSFAEFLLDMLRHARRLRQHHPRHRGRRTLVRDAARRRRR